VKKNLIGINCNAPQISTRDWRYAGSGDWNYGLDPRYVEAVQRAGGIPVLLPFCRTSAEADRFLEKIDGLLLSGGRDIRPRRWGERKLHPRTKLLLPRKEASDLLFARRALERRLPTLAVCLGIQTLNVARGGSLHQHLADLPGVSPAHRKSEGWHDVAVEPDSVLRDLLGRIRLRVNSFHHQGIRDVGRGLRVTARAPDGVVEAIEGSNRHLHLGIQWHPERMLDRADQRRLFAALISEARRS